jgi:TonB family protein
VFGGRLLGIQAAMTVTRALLLFGAVLAVGSCGRSLTPGIDPGGQTTQSKLGPLSFDPQGADFAEWVTHFKDEIYRRWTIPVSTSSAKVHVDIEFTVDRAGTLNSVRVLSSSGASDFDTAAQEALRSSRLLALPKAFPNSSVKMQVSFYGGPTGGRRRTSG